MNIRTKNRFKFQRLYAKEKAEKNISTKKELQFFQSQCHKIYKKLKNISPFLWVLAHKFPRVGTFIHKEQKNHNIFANGKSVILSSYRRKNDDSSHKSYQIRSERSERTNFWRKRSYEITGKLQSPFYQHFQKSLLRSFDNIHGGNIFHQFVLW